MRSYLGRIQNLKRRWGAIEKIFAMMSTTRHSVFLLAPVTPGFFKTKYVFNRETLRDVNLTNHIHFQSLEVVYRGSETQIQVTV